MTLRISDRVKETSTTTGTGAFTLAGGVAGYRAFSAVCTAPSDTVYYVIEGVNGDGSLTGEWEVGLGTYSGANTLTRTTVLASSNAGLAVNFSAGTKQVWIDIAAGLASDWARLSLGGTFSGELGVKAAAATDAALTLGAPSGAATTLHGAKSDLTAPSTATAALYGTKHILRTAAASFTCAALVFFSASSAALGATSTVTTVKGFEAADASAIGGTNNFAYWTDYAAASGKYAFRGAGTAQSRLDGPLGVLADPGAAVILAGSSSTHPSSATTIYSYFTQVTAPSTATAAFTGYHANLASAAAAFTLTALTHFDAFSATRGAGSTITNVRGFYARNAIAVGSNNYGFYSDIALATTTYQLYMGGTAYSFFGAPVGIANGNIAGSGAWLTLGGVLLPYTFSQGRGVDASVIAPSTMTLDLIGFRSTISTTAAAFTLASAIHFDAAQTTVGAGSTITNSRGFYARNAIAVGTNNYGFYSDINDATTTWQLYMAGTGQSYFAAPVGIMRNDALAQGAILYVGGGTTSTPHPSTTTSISAVAAQYAAPATATSNVRGFFSSLLTLNSAYTVTNLSHFMASATTKGAASAITNIRGFYVADGIYVTGSNVYGFYSDMTGWDANTYALYLAGTAKAAFGGPLYPAKDNKTIQGNAALYAGSGAPNNANGSDGDIYFRSDGGALTTIYQRRAGAWTGVV